MTVPTARAARGRPTCAASVAVGRRLAERDLGQLVEHGDREGREAAEVEPHVEDPPSTREVLVQLSARPVDAARRAQDSGPGDPRQPLELLVRALLERDRSETLVRDGDEQWPDRRVDHVVPDVDESEVVSRFAESAIEIGGDDHSAVLLVRILRTPVDVACRAASGLDPSAAAICSYERSYP